MYCANLISINYAQMYLSRRAVTTDKQCCTIMKPLESQSSQYREYWLMKLSMAGFLAAEPQGTIPLMPYKVKFYVKTQSLRPIVKWMKALWSYGLHIKFWIQWAVNIQYNSALALWKRRSQTYCLSMETSLNRSTYTDTGPHTIGKNNI